MLMLPQLLSSFVNGKVPWRNIGLREVLSSGELLLLLLHEVMLLK